MNWVHGRDEKVVRGARWLAVVLPGLCLIGCGQEPTAPVTITADQRTSIQSYVTQLGGRVTSSDMDALYLTLRNIHIQIRETGGVVEAAGRTMQDFKDFGRANEAIAKAFLTNADFASFQQWLQGAIAPTGAMAARAEYGNYQLSVSRAPLRVVFSPRSVPLGN